MENKKYCKKCDSLLSFSKFHKNYKSKDGLKNSCKICCKLVDKKRYQKKQKIIKNQCKKYRKSPEARIMTALESRVKDFIQKPLGGIKIIGCSRSELVKYLESKFQPGMSWDNYGEWHIDHIVPMSKFDLNNPIEFKKANYYTNLQPLWAEDNYKKGDYFM